MTHYIFITWREGRSTIESLDKSDFDAMRRGMIDEGFHNIHIEWYEPGDSDLPDHVLVFAYWEDPDSAPDYGQLQIMGSEAVISNRASA